MTLLETKTLTARYGDFQALFGVDFIVEDGETVAIIGANGAGKTTMMRAVAGLLPSNDNDVFFQGRPIRALAANQVVALGIAMVPEGRKLFPSLSVEENLLMGAYGARRGPWSLKRVYSLFPILQERRHSPATSLSGGQQQMVAIGRALMANPKLLLCDEISLGLAPIVIRSIYEALPGIRAEGVTMVIVEQDIARALAAADRAYCLQEGRVTLSGRAASLTREQIKLAYFGT